MPKIKTNDLLKNEPYSSIVHMLHVFSEEGLKLKHFRYELIGENDLKPRTAKKAIEYLSKKRYKYIHKIKRCCLKNQKAPVSRLRNVLAKLTEPPHKVISSKNGRYYLTDKDRYIPLVAEGDKKNIDYNVTINKLNTIEDVGINLYGYPSGKIPAFICPDHKKYLKRLFTNGVERIASGTDLLQIILLHISLQIKVNTWKDVIDTLENKEIPLLDRQILLSFYVISLGSSLMAYSCFNEWFDTDNSSDFWLLKGELITKCSTSEDGRIHHPPKTLSIKKPDHYLIDLIKTIDPSKKMLQIQAEFKKGHVIHKDVSYLILSLLLLPSVPEATGTLCVVSNPPARRFFDDVEIVIRSALRNISTESALAKMQDGRTKKELLSRLRGKETSEDFLKIVSEVFSSDGFMNDPLESYKKKKLDYRVKFEERERDELRYIMAEEGKNSVAISSLSKTTDIMEIIKLLAPKE